MDVLEGQGCSFHNQGESKPWRQSLHEQQRILKGGAFVDVPEGRAFEGRAFRGKAFVDG